MHEKCTLQQSDLPVEIIGRHAAWQEVYSIDESFIGMRGTVDELIDLGHRIRDDVRRCTGIPVRVGIGRTKTLAKLASRGAKALPELGGVCHIGQFAPAHLERIMAGTDVADLWGVASRTKKKLAGMGIFTARDLRDAELRLIRKRFSVVLARTVMELRGVPCIELEEHPPAAKEQLIYSRSFSRKLTTPAEMAQVTQIYAQRVGVRLRKQGSVTGVLKAWAATGWADEGTPPHSAGVSVPFVTATSDPIMLARAAAHLIPFLFLFPEHLPGVRCARVGVILIDLKPGTGVPMLELFERAGPKLGDTLDRINHKLGRHLVGVGLGGRSAPPSWEMKRAMLSRRATTHWSELCEARA